MRPVEDIESAREMIDKRMERHNHPLLLAIWRAKWKTLFAIETGETTPARVEQNTHEALLSDMDLVSYINVQAARNAAAWAAGDFNKF